MSGGAIGNDGYDELVRRAADEELAGGESDHDRKKRAIWEEMGSRLEDRGVPSRQIGKRVRRSIEDELERREGVRISVYSGYFYQVMRANNWAIHPKSADGEIAGEQNGFASGVDHALADAIETCMEALRSARDSADGIDLRDLLGDRYGVFRWELEGHSAMLSDMANMRTKVPASLQMTFRRIMAAESGMISIAAAFHEAKGAMLAEMRRSHTAWLTSKQAGKIRDCLEPAMVPLVRPRTREMAIFLGWYGLSCPSCGSWLVQESADGGASDLACHDCGARFRGYTVAHCPRCRHPMYDQIESYSGCPACGQILVVPPARRVRK